MRAGTIGFLWLKVRLEPIKVGDTEIGCLEE